MTISIDFDGTWTRSPMLWRNFVTSAIHAGHTVIMVTGRSGPSPDIERHNLPREMPIIYAGQEPKDRAARRQGYKVDVWIDDSPASIQECAVLQPSKDEEL